MRYARIALTCVFLRSIVSARATENTGTSSAHRYHDYRRCHLAKSPNYFNNYMRYGRATCTRADDHKRPAKGPRHPGSHQRGHGVPSGRPQPGRSCLRAAWGPGTADLIYAGLERPSRDAREEPARPPRGLPPPPGVLHARHPRPWTRHCHRRRSGRPRRRLERPLHRGRALGTQPHRRDRGGREARHIGCDCQANGSGSVIYQEDVRLGRRGGGVDEP